MSLNVALLESSFAEIRKQETEFMSHFYTTLFADYPEVKPLFANTHMAKQAKQLFKALVLVIDNLRHPDILSHALKGLGTRHFQYGVLPDHYPMVGKTLLKTLSLYLDVWTPTIEQAWSEAYAVVTQLMLDGAAYPVEVLAIDVPRH